MTIARAGWRGPFPRRTWQPIVARINEVAERRATLDARAHARVRLATRRKSEREQLCKRPLRLLIGRIHVHRLTNERLRSQQKLSSVFRLSTVGGERSFRRGQASEGTDFTRVG